MFANNQIPIVYKKESGSQRITTIVVNIIILNTLKMKGPLQLKQK